MTEPDELSSWISEVKEGLKKSTLAHKEASEDPIKEKNDIQKELQKSIKRAKGKAALLQDKLDECQKWQEIHHEGQLLQSHLYRWKHGLRSLSVEDWEQQDRVHEIRLTPPLSGHEEVALRFRKSKKLRLGIPHLNREIEKTTRFIETIEKILAKLEPMTEIAEILAFRRLLVTPIVKKTREEQEKTRALPYREFWTASGHAILVGKKAKDNELLTFRYAHGSDRWLHVHGFPGSHVVLTGFKQNEPDNESLQDALQLALFYSQAKKIGSADVIVTQQKHVSRFGKGKKTPGKVQIANFKTVPVDLDLARLEIIKKRTKPM